MVGKAKYTPEQRKVNRAASIARWKAKNPDYDKQYYRREADRHKANGAMNYRRVKDSEPWVLLYRASKERAKTKGWEHNITPEYLQSIWPTHCPVFGLELSVCRGGKPHDASPTIDRHDSNKGYVIGNVNIVSYKANVIKNNGTAEEHRLIAEYIDRLSEQRILSERTPSFIAASTDFSHLNESPHRDLLSYIPVLVDEL